MIQKIELISARIPLQVPFRIATMEVRSTDSLFVRVTDKEGLTGTGEGNPFQAIVGETMGTVFEAALSLSGFLLGRSAPAVYDNFTAMAAFLPNNVTARSAFDMALWDLAARRAGMPLYAFLGGTKRTLRTDNTIGLFEPEVMAARAASFVAAGIGAVKVKLGTDPETDIERIRLVREAVGNGVPIRIDANQGWSFPDAVRVLTSIEQYGIEYCEQPLPAPLFAQARELRRRTSIPIMADESLFGAGDALDLVREESCDYFNIKLSKSAGISGALGIVSVAEAAGIHCMMGCMSESRIYQSAAASLASARRVFRFADLDGPLMHASDPVKGGVRYEKDMVYLDDAPGHGAVLDTDAVEIVRREQL